MGTRANHHRESLIGMWLAGAFGWLVLWLRGRAPLQRRSGAGDGAQGASARPMIPAPVGPPRRPGAAPCLTGHSGPDRLATQAQGRTPLARIVGTDARATLQDHRRRRHRAGCARRTPLLVAIPRAVPTAHR